MFQRFALRSPFRGNIHRGLWSGNCLLCAARAPAGKDLCPACERSLPRTEWACPRCAAHGAAMEVEGVPCGECQTHPPVYVSARAAFRYASPVDKLIQHLKYHDRLELSRLLGGYLANHLQALTDPLPDVVVPVPLHSSRLRERGYKPVARDRALCGATPGTADQLERCAAHPPDVAADGVAP
jgi:predicted amidophosphoribosyltransferase